MSEYALQLLEILLQRQDDLPIEMTAPPGARLVLQHDHRDPRHLELLHDVASNLHIDVSIVDIHEELVIGQYLANPPRALNDVAPSDVTNVRKAVVARRESEAGVEEVWRVSGGDRRGEGVEEAHEGRNGDACANLLAKLQSRMGHRNASRLSPGVKTFAGCEEQAPIPKDAVVAASPP
jgi:hypothetical protein